MELNKSLLLLHCLGETFYYDPQTGDVSFSKTDLKNNGDAFSGPHSLPRQYSYSFCLNISDACNLHCTYCFNKTKTGRLLDANNAVKCLDGLFSAFPDGEKYFIDISGKGEPLLNLPVVLSIARYCKEKSNLIRREVLPMLVCNGTLLSPKIAETLQEHGVLFGISIDGPRSVHDKYRRTIDDSPTLDLIMSNALKIKNRQYVGVAGTLTKEVFDITSTILSLSKVFKTISFRLVRGAKYGLNEESLQKWMLEYTKLAERMFEDSKRNDIGIYLCLMNGDDLFGRYLCLAFGNQRTMNRCDSGISRFTCDMDGSIFGCPASCSMRMLAIKGNLQKISEVAFRKQLQSCQGCPFKLYCGGACEVDTVLDNGVENVYTCRFEQHLICLALALKLKVWSENEAFFIRLNSFCEEKAMRRREDPSLMAFLRKNPELNFVDGKKLFDSQTKRY